MVSSCQNEKRKTANYIVFTVFMVFHCISLICFHFQSFLNNITMCLHFVYTSCIQYKHSIAFCALMNKDRRGVRQDDLLFLFVCVCACGTSRIQLYPTHHHLLKPLFKRYGHQMHQEAGLPFSSRKVQFSIFCSFLFVSYLFFSTLSHYCIIAMLLP